MPEYEYACEVTMLAVVFDEIINLGCVQTGSVDLITSGIASSVERQMGERNANILRETVVIDPNMFFEPREISADEVRDLYDEYFALMQTSMKKAGIDYTMDFKNDKSGRVIIEVVYRKKD